MSTDPRDQPEREGHESSDDGGSSPSRRASDDLSERDVSRPLPGPARTAPRSVSELHLKGIIESLVFASDKPLTPADLARLTRAEAREIRRMLSELREDYASRGIHLEEVGGGWQFRSAAANAPFVRELLQAKPVKLSRAQVETLAIVVYRQPVTRPEIDEVRGVDSGAALKALLDRDLVRIMGRREEAGRPVLYGTSAEFLSFFGLKSLRDLPTLREFTELTAESEAELRASFVEGGSAATERPRKDD
jgi:segregation and condensation protein B